MDRVSWDEVFIQFLENLARRSTCLKLKTSAIIVQDTQIISLGYNGTFPHADECCDYWHAIYKKKNLLIPFDYWLTTDEFRDAHREWSCSEEVHAEANALKWVNKRDITDDTIMYSLNSPCDACAKDIIAHGIKTVFYKHKYKRGDNALERFKKYGVVCRQLV